MIKSRIIKFNLFFSFLLVLMLFISTASATLLHHYEDFDDDTVGQLPTNSWSVYGGGTKVSNADFRSAPNSVYSSSYLSVYSSFEINFPCTTNETRLEVQFEAKATANAWGFVMEGKNGIFAQARLQANQGNGTFNISFGNGTNWICPPRYFNYSEWLECEVEMDFVHQDYIFKIEDDCNGNKFYSVDYAHYANFMSGADNIEKFYITTYYAYVDDVDYRAPPVYPEASLVSPANNSNCNPVTADFSIHEWANDTIGLINSTVYLYIWNGITWSYVAEYNNDSITSGGYHNGSFDNPDPAIDIFLCNNRTYRWNVTLVSDGDTVYTNYSYFDTGCSPMSMTIWGYNETSGEYDDVNETNSVFVELHLDADADFMEFSDTSDFTDSVDYPYSDTFNYTLPCTGENGNVTVYTRFHDDCGYFYCNDTIYVNGSAPNLTLVYPVEDDAYDSVQWGEDHDVLFEGYMDESFSFFINVSSIWYTMQDDYADYEIGYDDNGDSYALVDQSPYVFFDDTNYTISFNVSNCFGYQNFVVNFTLGDPDESLGKHISLKDLLPVRENYSQLELLENGVTFDIISTETDGIYYRMFVTDWDNNVLYEDFDYAYLDNESGWQSHEYYSGRFYSRSFYKAWVGITDNDTQFDDLYGYAETHYMSFMDAYFYYVFNNSYNITYQEFVGRYQLFDMKDQNVSLLYDVNYTIYNNLSGVMWGFGTFKVGDIIPFHSIGDTLYDYKDIYANEWGQKFDDYFPGLSLFVGMMVILAFSVMPIIITKTFPPMSIELTFIEIGGVVSYAMGLTPLWIFSFMLIALLMAIFYKVFSWYQASHGATMFSDAPMREEYAGLKGKAKGAYGKAQWLGGKIKGLSSDIKSQKGSGVVSRYRK